MHTGLLADAGAEPGVYITGTALKLLNIKQGDYVEIQCPEQGTITRRVRDISTLCPVRDDYVYMDPNSMRYLCAGLHDSVEIKIAPVPMDFP